MDDAHIVWIPSVYIFNYEFVINALQHPVTHKILPQLAFGIAAARHN